MNMKQVFPPWQKKIPPAIKRILNGHKENHGIAHGQQSAELDEAILREINKVFYQGVKYGYKELMESLPPSIASERDFLAMGNWHREDEA